MDTRPELDCWRTFDGCARFVLSPSGEILHVCELGRRFLNGGTGLSRRRGRLYVRDTPITQGFLTRTAGPEQIVMLHRQEGITLVASHTRCRTEAGPGIALTIRAVEDGEVPVFACLGEAFQLTPAEESITARLLGGMAPIEVARCEGLSIHTIRSHIAHVYAKLNARNREEMWVKCAPYMVRRTYNHSYVINDDDANRHDPPYERPHTHLS